jgi:hypothetical protein
MVGDPTQRADMIKAAEAMMPALHLVYGWKMPRAAFTRLLTADMGTSELRLLISQDGREFVMGIPLAALRGDKSVVGVSTPKEAEKTILTSAVKALGFSDLSIDEPKLWLVDDRKGQA